MAEQAAATSASPAPSPAPRLTSSLLLQSPSLPSHPLAAAYGGGAKAPAARPSAPALAAAG
eukprot:2292608-Pyramimonas_sp.AAC.1